jgi:hypothetical protein
MTETSWKTRTTTSSRARAAMISSVCAYTFGRIIGQSDHSSISTRKHGIGTGSMINNSADGLT